MSNELSQEDKDFITELQESIKKLQGLYIALKERRDNEQQAPVEWKVGEWAKTSGGRIFLIDELGENGSMFGYTHVSENDWVVITAGYVETLTKPTKEEIEQHLVKIAEKKYPVGTTFKGLVSEDNEYVVIDHNFKYYDNGETQDLSLYGYMVWRDGKWAEPITEQKERWYPLIGEQYYYITELFTVKSAIRENCIEDELRIVIAMNFFKTLQSATKAAEQIRETLKNL